MHDLTVDADGQRQVRACRRRDRLSGFGPKVDNVVTDGALGLADLGVARPRSKPIIPIYLYR
jgi:hypothetical protein